MRMATYIVIRGRVQGVGYRAFVEHEALKSGLEGWVRNRNDGSVEVLLVGPDNLVAAVVDACRRGPSTARVDEFNHCVVTSDEVALRRAGEKFSVLQTV
jgi:acylphosphatase